MKKKLISAIMALLLTISFALPMVFAANTSSIKIAVNDSVIAYPKNIKPIIDKGVIYVPLEVFTSYLGVSYSYDSVIETLSIFSGKRALYFNMSVGVAFDENGNSFDQTALYKFGTFMVPIGFTAQKFGFSYSYIGGGPIVRVYTGNALLTNNQLLGLYLDSLAPPTTTPQPLTPTTPESNLPIRNCYLTFSGINDTTAGFISSLRGYGMHGTFFVTYDDIVKNPKVINSIVSNGHTLGIMIPLEVGPTLATDVNTLLRYVNSTNELMQKIKKSPTYILMFSNDVSLSPDVFNFLNDGKYHLFENNLAVLANNTRTENIIYKSLTTVLDNRKSTTILHVGISPKTLTLFQRIIPYTHSKNYVFPVITYQTPPTGRQ